MAQFHLRLSHWHRSWPLDEGGVSFWLPGIYGSLAATPLQPGWSGAVIYYHDSVSVEGFSPSLRHLTMDGRRT